MLEQARKSYKEVLERYPTSDKAGLAKSRLEALGA
jgi:TolA-binding protein